MRSVARQGEDPHPERDLPAEAAGLIGAAAVLHARILALVTTMAAGTADGDVILELAGAGARLGENSAGLREVASALADAAAVQFCLAQDPAHADAHLLLAELHLALGNTPAAAQSLEMGLSSNFEVGGVVGGGVG